MLKKMQYTLSQIGSSADTLNSVITTLVPFVALEFTLLRVLMRMGYALPKGDFVEALGQWLGFIGGVTFNMAFLLSTFALVLITLILTRNSRINAGLSILLFSVLVTGFLFYLTSNPIVSLVYNLLSFSVLVLTTLNVRQQNRGISLFLLFLTLTYFCSYYFKVASSITDLNISVSLPLAPAVFNIGELLSLIAAVLTFFAFKPKITLLKTIIASSATITFIVAALRIGVLPLVSTWALYFTLHLPIWAYAIALWFYVYMVVELITRAENRQLAYGLLLIAFGGRMLQMTYLNQLVLLGFLLLSLPLSDLFND